jgi:hypothetical protein
MIRVTTLVAMAAALLVAVSGCGGSKKSSAGASAGSASTTTTGNGTSSNGTSSSGSSSSGGSSSGAYGSGSSSSGSSSSGSSSTGSSSSTSKSCLNFAGAASKLGQALAAGSSASQNGESLKTYFNALAEKAPSDIKASFQTLANAISKYVDEIKKLNLKPGKTPSAEQIQKVQAALASIGTPDVQAASNKIQAWVNAGCHS